MDNSYKDVPGPSTVYKFKVKGEDNTFLLAWSTTPWTKLVTTALAVNPDLTYVKARQGDACYILAEDTLKMLNGEFSVVETYKGKDLERLAFEMHYDFYPDRAEGERAGVVVADDYVSATDGTGIVTMAVYGEEDYRVMKARGIQLAEHVDTEGKLKPEVTPWAGMFILKADPLVNEDLKQRGLIYHDEVKPHSVPTCYRCSTQLYYSPVPAWFIDVQKLKPELLKQNENITWYPEHLKHGRFGKGLETAPDWNISRSRYWGNPMPVWVGEKTGAKRVLGSYAELKEWAVDPSQVASLTDYHREFIDPIEVWVDDARTEKGRRVNDIFDCWVESGSMPFASVHAPFERKEWFEENFPAQFVTEYIAQTRAWFYVMHVMSVGLFGSHAVDNILTTGTVLAEDGSKMSKSKKNYPDPQIVLDRYGADAVRLYLMSNPIVNGENMNFSEKGVDEMAKKFLTILKNVLSFYGLYAAHDDGRSPAGTHVLDAWVLARLHETLRDETTALKAYNLSEAARALQHFVTDLSTWYVRRSRDRFKSPPARGGDEGGVEGSSDQAEALATLRITLETLSKMIAPFTPFLGEILYQGVGGAKESVHLEVWPRENPGLIRTDVLEAMGRTRSIVSRVLERRTEAGIAVRQVLAKAIVSLPEGTLDEAYIDVVKDEINVKEVVLQKGDYAVELDLKLTPELIREGTIREMVRRVNDMRKKAGLTIGDRIELYVSSGNMELTQALEEHRDALLSGTLSKSLRTTGHVPEIHEELRINEIDMTIGLTLA